MICSSVGLVSLMGGALCPVIAKVRFFFNPALRLFIQPRGSFPLSYLHPQFKIWVISYISIHAIPTIAWIEHCVRSSQKPGCDSKSSLNLFSGSFSTAYLGCLFDCEDHFHFHGISILNSRGNVNRPTNRNARGNNFVHFKNSTRKESADAKNWRSA